MLRVYHVNVNSWAAEQRHVLLDGRCQVEVPEGKATVRWVPVLCQGSNQCFVYLNLQQITKVPISPIERLPRICTPLIPYYPQILQVAKVDMHMCVVW